MSVRDIRLTGQVNDSLGSRGGERAAHRFVVEKIHRLPLERGMARKVFAGAEGSVNFIAARQALRGEMAADESGRAGDQNAHVGIPRMDQRALEDEATGRAPASARSASTMRSTN